MENFLRVNKAIDINAMYGKEVYLTIFPDEPEGHFIYKGTLLGYGAYGKNPEHKTFCVYVDRGDGYSVVDYFQDKCFTVERLSRILDGEENYIDVKVKVGDMVYPIVGVADQSKSIKEPAFVLKADTEKGKIWEK